MVFRKWVSIVCALSACVLMALPSGVEAKSSNKLSFMGNYPERHPTPARVWLPLFEETKKKFPGVDFTYYSQNTLYPERESFHAVSDGRVDFGCVRASQFPGQMNLMGGVEIPGIAPNALVGSLVTQEMVEKFPEVVAEFPVNTVPYVAWTSAAYQLHTLHPVRSMDALRDKKIIVWDPATGDIIRAMGGTPIRMSSSETALALSKGVAEGVYCPIAPLRSLRISEHAKHHTIINMGVATFNIFANKQLWDGLPADMRSWMQENSGMKMALAIGKSLEDGQAADIKLLEGEGHQFYFLSDAERSAFLEPMKAFEAKWVENCKGFGVPKVDEVLVFIKERVSFHTKEMKAGTYGNYAL